MFNGGGSQAEAVPTWCPGSEAEFHSIFGGFEILDTGYAAHKYAGSEIHEFLVCARKPC